MKSSRTIAFALALALAFAAGAGAQAPAYAPATGDTGLDAELARVNDYGRDEREPFVDGIVERFGAPRYLLGELLDARHWLPGDVYYACALAYQARRPCAEVARAFEDGKGQGWATVARSLGLGPGSAGFRALKARLLDAGPGARAGPGG